MSDEIAELTERWRRAAECHAMAVERYGAVCTEVMRSIADGKPVDDVHSMNSCDHIDDELLALWNRAHAVATGQPVESAAAPGPVEEPPSRRESRRCDGMVLLLIADLRASRAREAEAYGVGFEQCRRRAVQADAERDGLQQRIDKALAECDKRFEFHTPRAMSARTAACLDLHHNEDSEHTEDCFEQITICNGCGTAECKYAEFIATIRAALTGTSTDG